MQAKIVAGQASPQAGRRATSRPPVKVSFRGERTPAPKGGQRQVPVAAIIQGPNLIGSNQPDPDLQLAVTSQRFGVSSTCRSPCIAADCWGFESNRDACADWHFNRSGAHLLCELDSFGPPNAGTSVPRFPQNTMNPTPHEAALLLWTCRQSGTAIDALPAALRPQNTAAGHAIQAALPAVADQPVVGWKIAATGAAGQSHIQVDGPLCGRILGSFVQPIGGTVSLAGNRMRVVEPEFAFRMGAALPPRATPYAADEVLAAVASLHPAFELPDSRFSDFARAGKAQLIADDACCGQFAFGPAAPAAWRTADLAAHGVHATVCDAAGRERYTRDGQGSALLGNPLIALTWLANELLMLGIGLRAGDWASCGTCMVPLEVLPGDRVVADYGTLGRIELGLSD